MGGRGFAGAALFAALLAASFPIAASPPSAVPDQGYAFVTYQHASGFRLPVPVGWDIEANQAFEGLTIELVLYGPYADGFQSNILVETDRDPSVRETSLYMSSLYQATIDDIRADDPTAAVSEGPLYRSIGNHSGVLFEVRYGSDNVIQVMAISVSDPHDRFWFLILSTTLTYYASFGPMFVEMLDGFEITIAPASGPSLLVLGVIAGVAAAIGVGAVFAILAIRRRRRPAPTAWPGPAVPLYPTGPMTSPQSPGFCPSCGSAVISGSRFCTRCGRELPTLPFASLDSPASQPPPFSPPPSGP